MEVAVYGTTAIVKLMAGSRTEFERELAKIRSIPSSDCMFLDSAWRVRNIYKYRYIKEIDAAISDSEKQLSLPGF